MTPDLVSVLGFAALLLVGLALEGLARGRRVLPTAARALEAAMRRTPGRVLVLATWVWLGVHFLAR